MEEKKIFCPHCGEEIDLEMFIAKVGNLEIYQCDFCDVEVNVTFEENEIKIGW